MTTSYYNFYLDEFDSKQRGLVYNTNSGTVLAIRQHSIWEALTNDQLDSVSKDDLSILIDNKMCVESCERELAEIRERYENHTSTLNTLYLTIMPTEACNFACPYCFLWEKVPHFMTGKTYQSILKYVLKCVSENRSLKHLMINWFGGEPTLCAEQICQFMSEITSAMRPLNVNVTSSITTNGYLLTRDVFLNLISSGVFYYQVTVDGMKETHNAGRPHKSDPDSYERIIHNLEDIHHLEAEYQMDIRTNFTRSSIPSVDAFIDFFKAEFAGDPRFHLYCRPVYDYETKENSIETMRSDILDLEEGIIQQNIFAEKIAAGLENRTMRRMVDPLPQPTHCWCNAETKGHIVIGPEGEIFICDTLTGADNSLGNLIDGEIVWNSDKTVAYDIFNDSRTAKCLKCRILPICMGGCLRNRMSNEAQCYWTEHGIQKALEKFYG